MSLNHWIENDHSKINATIELICSPCVKYNVSWSKMQKNGNVFTANVQILKFSKSNCSVIGAYRCPVKHTYDLGVLEPGTYIFILKVWDEEVKRLKFNISKQNLAPIADFAYSPQSPRVCEAITFNASSSYDPDGTIVKYEWDFGDGNVMNTAEPIITHSYALAGDYIVNLTVTDNDGAKNSTSKVITVAAGGPTYVSGIISSNTTWTAADSPYIVTGNILVEEGVTLIIEPGVEIKFDGDYYIMVKGTLKAQGTPDSKIIFTSNRDKPAPGDWGSIYFSESSINSIIDYCIIEYGGSYAITDPLYGVHGAILIYDSSPKILHSIFRENDGCGNIACVGRASPEIRYNKLTSIKRTGAPEGGGIFCWVVSGQPIITNNSITSNINGIYFTDPPR